MQAHVIQKNGHMVIEINGKPYSFAATRSFRPEGRILKDFSDHGLKFFNIFPSGIMTALEKRTVPYSQFGPVWVGEGQYNWDNLRAQCREVFDNIAPDTYVSVNVHLDPPDWFVAQHPKLVDHWEQMIQNLGSEIWKSAAADYLRALIDKLDEWYPERVYAIFLMCGGTTEWYSYHIDKIIDAPTEVQKQAYQDFCKDQRAEIPSREVLHAATDGVIRSRQKNAEAIRYWEFTNEIVTDTILYFAKIAKEHTGGTRLVGLFSGHIYGQNLDFAVQTSYNRLDKLLNSPDIDMLFCPASYLFRKLDSTSGIRVPVDSITCHGKLFSHEIDSSTHLLKRSTEAAAVSHAVGRDETFTCSDDTISYIRREVGMILAKGQGYWWFDMFSGYYDDPVLMNEIKRLHQIQEQVLGLPSRSVSEVTQMLDTDSNYLLKTNTYYPMTEHQTAALNATGAPWDMNMTFDFECEGFDENQYKLYFFPALFAPSKAVCDRIAALRQKGKNMLYCHAPFYALGDTLSTANMEAHTGIRFEQCELTDNTVRLCFPGAEQVTFALTNQTVKGDIWHHKGCEQIKPIFSPTNLDVVLGRFAENGKPACGFKFRPDGGFDAFSACAPMPVELIREFYRYAHVFFYADRPMPVYTSSSFACLYSFEGGEVTLYRPEPSVLTDCFTKERLQVDRKGTKVHFAPHEVKFFTVHPQKEGEIR
ncbi:MAG: hypothetical protein IJX39_06395 [Clostridia bacterium]|nr:hypothetical protein [Clostridia bacterium]